MGYQIRTPIVRIFALFYGNLAFQFLPISISTVHSLVNLLQNITIFCILISTQLFFDCYGFFDYVTKLAHLRPFMSIIFSNVLTYSYPVLNFTNISYYFFYGRQIIILLDNDFFYQVCASFRFTKLFFTLYIAVLQLYTGLLTFERLVMFVRQFSLISVMNIFTLVIISTMLLINYVIIHYYLYATRQSLIKLESQLQNGLINRKELFSRLRAIARVNEQLNFLLSLPYSTFLLIVIVDNITTISLYLVLETESMRNFIYTFLIHNTVVCLYNVYLVVLNRQVVNRFRGIVAEVKLKNELESVATKEKMVTRKVTAVQEEIAIFESCFCLRIFHMWNVTHGNLLSMMLFILGYTVFLYQTK